LLDVVWRESLFEEQRAVHWRSFFPEPEEVCRMYVPMEPFVFCATSSDLLAKMKIQLDSPALLRSWVPGVLQGFRLVGDFLTGYTIPLKRGDRCFELSATIAKRL
jgi:hypothetical protein